MRKLNIQDAFKFGRIIKATNIKSQLAQFFANGKTATVDEVGAEFVFTLFENASSTPIENMIYEFLAGVCEKDVEEIKNSDLDTIIELVTEIANQNNLKRFFKTAASVTT